MAHSKSGSRGKARHVDERDPRNFHDEEEVQIVNILNLEKELEFRLTTDERWALDVMFGPPNPIGKASSLASIRTTQSTD